MDNTISLRMGWSFLQIEFTTVDNMTSLVKVTVGEHFQLGYQITGENFQENTP